MAVSVSLKSFVAPQGSVSKFCVRFDLYSITGNSANIQYEYNFYRTDLYANVFRVCLKPSQRSMVEIHCENHKMSQNGYRMSIFI